jgi:hypothetical protein
VVSRRNGRSIIYSADFGAMQRLMGFLTENCCMGDPAACDLQAAGAPAPQRRISP